MYFDFAPFLLIPFIFRKFPAKGFKMLPILTILYTSNTLQTTICTLIFGYSKPWFRELIMIKVYRPSGCQSGLNHFAETCVCQTTAHRCQLMAPGRKLPWQPWMSPGSCIPPLRCFRNASWPWEASRVPCLRCLWLDGTHKPPSQTLAFAWPVQITSYAFCFQAVGTFSGITATASCSWDANDATGLSQNVVPTSNKCVPLLELWSI